MSDYGGEHSARMSEAELKAFKEEIGLNTEPKTVRSANEVITLSPPPEVKDFMNKRFKAGDSSRAVRRAVMKKFNIKVEIR